MSKIIRDVRGKLLCGQNLFRRSTIQKMLDEYDRLLMRNTALEEAAKHGAQAEEEDALEIVLESYRDVFGTKTDRANEIHRLACAEVARLRASKSES